MLSLKKALLWGLLTATIGVVFIPFMRAFEEGVGLDLLFKLRGQRMAPEEVVVITLDKASADHLGLPPEPYKWSRSLHAKLTRILSECGAELIAFDLIFKQPGSFSDDEQFVRAIRDSGNVVLCEQLNMDIIPLKGMDGSHEGGLKIERVVPLIPSFAQAAIATAPFPLPKVPVKVSQYWKFKPSAGGIPTLPVAAFQVFALNAYTDFSRLLNETSFGGKAPFPVDPRELISGIGVIRGMMLIHNSFEQEPQLGSRLLAEVEKQNAASFDSRKTGIITSLIAMYEGGNSDYLDYYGPPGSIHTIPFYEMLLRGAASPVAEQDIDLRGKAVFVGLSERLRPEEKDGFYTSFSQQSGVDISGVEIAATAFANLLENRRIHPLSIWSHVILIFFSGIILGICCYILPTPAAALSVTAIGSLYVVVAHFVFKTSGTWPPLVLPVMVQIPLAFFGTLLGKYMETHAERQNVKMALRYYVPKNVADHMGKDPVDAGSNKQLFQGTCLCTDAENYTTLSESMNPDRLRRLMNEYFQAIFEPVKKHGGTVVEVVGDSMIAVWPVSASARTHREKACHAALDIVAAVNQFNRLKKGTPLPTRIGIHTGHMMIGNIGAMDRYEYNPIGDLVNTASRIEGLNKYMGTRILASREVAADLDDFLTRELGKFILAGKSRPVAIFEILCRREQASEEQTQLCLSFEKALGLYRNRMWEQGFRHFSDLHMSYGEDGPSRFFSVRCNNFVAHPTKAPKDDVINLNMK